MAKVKIKDVKTGVVKEVEKSLASDFIGTKKFVIFEEEKKQVKNEEVTTFKPKFDLKIDKNDKD